MAGSGNKNLGDAKNAKNDEFYTQYNDIAAELKHYSKYLKGKTVFCNCDDPTWSNFWKYLHENFSVLGLHKLISTHYIPDGSPSYMMEYEGGEDLNTEAGTITPLRENGDFRSTECLELLDRSDVVITNPPFSNYQPAELIQLCLEHEKKFILIGSKNLIHYKKVFPLLRDNKIWLGNNAGNGTMWFGVPGNGPLESKPSYWYTNIDIKKRHQPFFPKEDAHRYYEGFEDRYPKYTNYDAIDVGSLDLIPIDYQGYMGVPDTLFNRYNPDDFEIIGLGSGKLAASIGVKKNYRGRTDVALCTEGKDHCPYSRVIIRNCHPISKQDDV